MNKDKLNLIYTLVSNGEILTKELLYKHNFTDADIENLIDDDRLYEAYEGEYDISYTTDLLDFAADMLIDRNYFIAEKAINKCYEEIPNDYEVINYKFMNDLSKSYKTNDYKDVINYLVKMAKIADDYQKKDVNMYIYLLNIITTLPNDLKLTAKYMPLDDVYLNITDNRFIDIYNRNTIRKNAYFQKYSVALKETKNIEDKTYNNFVYDRTIARLIEESRYRQRKLNKKMLELAKNDEIEDIINLFIIEEDKRSLTRHEEYTLKLCKDLVNIRNSKIVPVPKIENNVNFNFMVDNHDYKGALNRVIELDKTSKLPLDETINYILLVKILKEIDNLKNTKKLSLNNNIDKPYK